MLYGHTEEGCVQQHICGGQRATLAVDLSLPLDLRQDLTVVHCCLSQAAALEPLDSPVSTSSCCRSNAEQTSLRSLGLCGIWGLELRSLCLHTNYFLADLSPLSGTLIFVKIFSETLESNILQENVLHSV